MGSDKDLDKQADHRQRLPTGFTTIRDAITFVIGMLIICNEVFLQAKVDPTTIAIGVGMSGLPLVFGADERRRAPEKGNEPPKAGE